MTLAIYQGYRYRSQGEWIFAQQAARRGLPFVHEPGFRDHQTNERREPDFYFPCADGRHGAAVELCGMLREPSYRSTWLRPGARMDWYERNSGRMVLVLIDTTEPTLPDVIEKVLDIIEQWLADGGKQLHALLGQISKDWVREQRGRLERYQLPAAA